MKIKDQRNSNGKSVFKHSYAIGIRPLDAAAFCDWPGNSYGNRDILHRHPSN